MSGRGDCSDLVGREQVAAAAAASVRHPELRGALIYGDAGMGKSAVVDCIVAGLSREVKPFHLKASAALAGVPYGAMSHFLVGLQGKSLKSPVVVLRWLRHFFAQARVESRLPPLVVVDDAHELDEHTSHVLEQLLVAGIIKLLATTRDHRKQPEVLMALSRDGLLAQFTLAPLTEVQVTEISRRSLGGRVGAGAAAMLTNFSEGNPFLLKALLSSGLRTGQLVQRNGVWLAREGHELEDPALLDAVHSLMENGTPEQRRVLQVISLVEPVPMSSALQLVDAAVLEKLISAGTLDIADARNECLVFHHRLAAEVLRKQVPVGRSAEIRRHALDTMGQALPDSIGHTRWVTWTMETGGTPTDAELLDAARRANAVFDPRLALRFTSTITEPSLITAARVQSALAHLHQSDVVKATAAIDGTLEAATDHPTLSAAAMAAVHIVLRAGGAANDVHDIADRWSDAAGTLTENTAATQGDGFLPVHPGSELLHCCALNLEGRYAESFRSLNRIIAAEHPNPQVGILADILVGEALGATGQGLAGAEATLRAIEKIGADPVLLEYYPAAVYRHLNILLQGGWAEEFAEQLTRHARDAPENLRYFGDAAPALQGILEIKQGQVRAGLDHLAAGIEALRERDLDLMLPYALGNAALAAMLLGEQEQAKQFAGEVAAVPYYRSRPQRLVANAYVMAARLGLQAAHDDATALLQHSSEARIAGMTAAEKEILELLTLVGGVSHLERLMDATRNFDGPEAEALHACAAALISGDPQRMADAGTEADALGKHLIGAECLARAARAYEEQGKAGRQRSVLQQLRLHNAGLAGVRTFFLNQGDVSTGSLTGREKEIVQLVLNGATNRRIAEILTVSPRTVEGHLYRIYTKLGVRRRDDLGPEHLGN